MGVPGGKVTGLDGLSLEFSDGWFNVRCSNTGPLTFIRA